MALTGSHVVGDPGHTADHNLIDIMINSGVGVIGAAFLEGTFGTGMAENTPYSSTSCAIVDSYGDHGFTTDGSTFDFEAGLYLVTYGPGGSGLSFSGGAATDIHKIHLQSPVGGSTALVSGTLFAGPSETIIVWYGTASTSKVFDLEFDTIGQTGRTLSLGGNKMYADVYRLAPPS